MERILSALRLGLHIAKVHPDLDATQLPRLVGGELVTVFSALTHDALLAPRDCRAMGDLVLSSLERGGLDAAGNHACFNWPAGQCKLAISHGHVVCVCNSRTLGDDLGLDA